MKKKPSLFLYQGYLCVANAFEIKDALKASGAGFRFDMHHSKEWSIPVAKIGSLDARIKVLLRAYTDDEHILDLLKTVVVKKKIDTKGIDVPIVEGVTWYPYQVVGIDFLAKSPYALVADDMGVGKSAQAIGACIKVRANHVLVVCPAIVKYKWAREFEKFSGGIYKPLVVNSGVNLPQVPTVLIINYDLLDKYKRYLDHVGMWDVVILDEAHYIKNPKAKRTILLLGKKENVKGFGWTTKVAPVQAKHKWLLTGTPILKSGSDLLPLLKFMNSSVYDFRFMLKYMHKKTFGGYESSPSEMLALGDYLVSSGIMLRRMKEEVMADLPDTIYDPQIIYREELTKAELDSLNEDSALAQTLGELLSQKHMSIKTIFSEGKVSIDHMSAVRHKTGTLKVRFAYETIMERIEYNKVVVGAIHRDVLEGISQRLTKAGVDHVVINGSVAPKKRMELVDRFQDKGNKCMVALCNIKAAGTGIELTAAPEVIMVEEEWNPADNMQFKDRIRRIGQDASKVIVRPIFIDGTIDHLIQEANFRKEMAANLILCK